MRTPALQIYLPEKKYRDWLKNQKKEKKVSMSQVIRELIEKEWLNQLKNSQ